MGIWTHSLKFNVGTGGIHQLPQTTGDGIHSLRQEVVWDVGDKVPNPVLQLFHCARFCPVHLLLCPAPHEKVTSDPTRHVRSVQCGGAPSCMKTSSSIVFPARYNRPHVIFQHMKRAFGIHGVTQKIWAEDPRGRHSTPHSYFWTILHLLHRH